MTNEFRTFVYNNYQLLESLYDKIKDLNETIEFLTFCEFVYNN